MPARRILPFLRALTVVTVLFAALLDARPAAAQQDPRAKQEQVRKQRAQAAADVNALKSDAAAVQRALADLQANVAGQEALLSDATLAANLAEQAAAQARAAADAARVRVVELRGEVRQLAVSAYVQGRPSTDDLGTPSGDPSVALTRDALARFRVGRSEQALDQLRAAEEDAAIAQAAADANAAEAQRKRAEIARRTSQVRSARDQQAAYAAQVESRLDRRLAEAASLAAVDKELSRQIAAQEAALAARIPRGSGGTVTYSNPNNVQLRTVRGITVAASIADQLERMLGAASADGVDFGGSGYRDPSQQQAARRQNCANPDTDPPSACRPPTARPGSSNHERGLAIDFTVNGQLVRSSSDPGYRWLSARASSFGFYNLPGEPWHWSVDGN